MARPSLPLLLLPLMLLPACAGGPDQMTAPPPGVTVMGAGQVRTEPDVSTEDTRALARAQLELAVDVYAALARESDGDLAFGPTSIHTALLMVRAGARGDTAQEMDAVLRLGDSPDPHAAANALDRTLQGRSETDGIELASANRVWADRTFAPREDYVAQLATAYGAALATLDLQGDPEGAREAINAWVAEGTRDRIPELFPPGTPTTDSRLVLANAVALDADWETPFDQGDTRDEPFRLLDGSTVQVPTMNGTATELGRGDGWTAVRLPYAGAELAMTVVVPEDLAAFERSLSAERLDQVHASLHPGDAPLSLPRFTARSAAGLTPVLADLGMASLFDERRADLSGINEAEQLFVGSVQHEAVVKVDEKGTEAAAATGVDIRVASAPRPVVVDRPFLFVVRDTTTGAVLFLGRVTDPR